MSTNVHIYYFPNSEEFHAAITKDDLRNLLNDANNRLVFFFEECEEYEGKKIDIKSLINEIPNRTQKIDQHADVTVRFISANKIRKSYKVTQPNNPTISIYQGEGIQLDILGYTTDGSKTLWNYYIQPIIKGMTWKNKQQLKYIIHLDNVEEKQNSDIITALQDYTKKLPPSFYQRHKREIIVAGVVIVGISLISLYIGASILTGGAALPVGIPIVSQLLATLGGTGAACAACAAVIGGTVGAATIGLFTAFWHAFTTYPKALLNAFGPYAAVVNATVTGNASTLFTQPENNNYVAVTSLLANS